MSKGKIHYGWYIFAAICSLNCTGFALSTFLASVFLLPVSTALGVDRSALALWLSIHSIISIVMTPIWGRLLNSKRINLFMSIAAVGMVAALLLFSVADSLWMFYLGGAIIGLCISPTSTLGYATLAGNWFAEGTRGKLLGVASAFSGVATIIYAPLFGAIIANWGYQVAYIVSAVLFAVLSWPFTMKIIKRRPEDMGLEPLGAEKVVEGHAEDVTQGLSASRVFKTWAFWALAVTFALFAIGMGFNSNQVGIATEFLVGTEYAESAAMIGATMISVFGISDVISKIAFGWLMDRLGFKSTSVIYLVLFLLTFVSWGWFHDGLIGLYAGAFFLGTHGGIIQVGLPLVVKQIFGPKDYSQILSFLIVPKSIVSGFGTSIIALFYDAAGSYMGAMYFGIGLVIVLAIGTMAAASAIGKVKWDDPVANQQAPIAA